MRWQGLSCRHGRVADAGETPRLIGDCDVVVNCSLATGNPAEIRRVEDRIATHLFRYSKPDATIVHFSTQSVYGDPAPGRWVRWRNPYGRAKLATERTVRREAKRTRKPTYILRLGHVCGSMQEISNTIRAQIAMDSVALPEQDRSSNTVHTIAIVDALIQIMDGRASPGTYDLMNFPRWSWRQVYAYEARSMGRPLAVRAVAPGAPAAAQASRKVLSSLSRLLIGRQWTRDALSKLFAHLPQSVNARGQAWWYRRRARMEIAGLGHGISVAEHLSWVENGRRFFPAGASTTDLLELQGTAGGALDSSAAWALDLPAANPSSDRGG